MFFPVKAAFLQALAADARPAFAALDDEPLEILADRARAAHPTLPFDPARFAALLASRLGPSDGPEELTALHAADLHLADGCGRGHAAALRAFEQLHGADIDLAVAKSGGRGVSRDELRQLFRDKMFVAERDRPPRIQSYGGRGALRSWVRVAAARLVVDLARRAEPVYATPDEELARRLPTDDPEVAYLRHAYGDALPAAFETALGGLSVRQRNLLRQRFLHGLTADRLATMYGVHRATVFEWLGDARAALTKELRQALATRVPDHQLESVVDLLGSHLELSVRRMLDSRLESEP
jgi:RNA polymerase sigma-70 factor, ECF subfamily